MILHRLILHHLSHRDDPDFYRLQARDAIGWIARQGVELSPATRVLDLGCGHGILGGELMGYGCDVWFADERNSLLPHLPADRFLVCNIDEGQMEQLGRYDLVICSNVYEHLAHPQQFLKSMPHTLKPGGRLYLSWTNWLSPWGGHEFSPFHYLGAKHGPRIYDRFCQRPRIHTPYVNLFPTSIGTTLASIRKLPTLRIRAAAPRYYPELAALVWLPWLREFLTWNCALLLEQRELPNRPVRAA
jgi:SAM-dependent methyltransferase